MSSLTLSSFLFLFLPLTKSHTKLVYQHVCPDMSLCVRVSFFVFVPPPIHYHVLQPGAKCYTNTSARCSSVSKLSHSRPFDSKNWTSSGLSFEKEAGEEVTLLVPESWCVCVCLRGGGGG